MHRTVLIALAFLASSCATVAPPSAAPAPEAIAEKTAGLASQNGFLPLHWNENEGKLLLEIPRLGEELIYQVSLAAGIGSNPIGLDRGQLGETHLVRFERYGPRILLVQPNQRFRALSGEPGEVEAVEESFATSVLWSFEVEAEQGDRILVDATEFFLRDAHGVADRLREADQGSYRVEPGRSAIYPPRTKAFPKNTEVEAIVTLVTGDRPGALVRSVTPTPQIVTVRQHHSFVELPQSGYEPRELDPRAGLFGIEIYDYSSPFEGPLEKRFIARHRLQKKDPAAAVSEPVEPIVYYVDHGVPEPIRSALVEGASWWAEAFEKAGWRDAFRVEILPEDVDPMDVRYNVIHWVHRSTRGWSYGSGVVDPRTGEILKGNVSLGSLRIRQDVMLASGLVPPYEGPNPAILAQLDRSVSPTEMALARIRQLSAHEVGHTLGIAHNFAASTYDRASVMDYPAPMIEIRDGRLDLSNAYDDGIGAFDVFAIRYGYAEFAPGVDETAALREIVHDGIRDGMLFVADQHARDAGSAHPLGAVWDNGADPVATLAHEIEVRRIALDQFGLQNLRPGRPLSDLGPIFLPLYLHHRYQLEAALKSLGGAFFTYSVREDDAIVPLPVREIVPPERQREALRLAMQTLDPAFLAVPERILALIPPPAAFGFDASAAERFGRRTDPLFDPVEAARASAALTLNALLHPARAARLLRFHAENSSNPSLLEVTGAVVDHVARVAPWQGDGAYEGSLLRGVRSVAVSRLIRTASDESTDPGVRAVYAEALRDLAHRLRARGGDGIEAADRRATADEIDRFLGRPAPPAPPVPAPPVPAGPPIG